MSLYCNYFFFPERSPLRNRSFSPRNRVLNIRIPHLPPWCVFTSPWVVPYVSAPCTWKYLDKFCLARSVLTFSIAIPQKDIPRFSDFSWWAESHSPNKVNSDGPFFQNISPLCSRDPTCLTFGCDPCPVPRQISTALDHVSPLIRDCPALLANICLPCYW